MQKRCLGLMLLVSSTSYAQWNYQLYFDDKDPLSAFVEVDTSSQPVIELLPSKSLSGTSAVSVECYYQPRVEAPTPDVESQGYEVLTQPDPEWIQMGYGAPLSCNNIRWQLNFESNPELGFDTDKQPNTYSEINKWHILSEWDSFPRIKGAQRAQICIEPTRCYQLPQPDQAVLFLPIGLPSLPLNVGRQQLMIYSDHPFLMEQLETWQPTLERQILYLRVVFQARAGKPIELVVLANEQSETLQNGVKGDQIYITNAAYQPIEPDSAKEEATDELRNNPLYPQFLKLAASETLKFVSGLETPLWLSESLSEYYAQKSLSDTEFAWDDPVEVWLELEAEPEFKKLGLYQASRKVEEGQQSYQMLFYTKGVAFWSEMDLLLQRHGSSLDNYIVNLKQLLAEQAPSKVTLPAKFVTQIEEVVGQQAVQDLESNYLKTLTEE